MSESVNLLSLRNSHQRSDQILGQIYQWQIQKGAQCRGARSEVLGVNPQPLAISRSATAYYYASVGGATGHTVVVVSFCH